MNDIVLAFPLFSIITCFIGAVICSILPKNKAFVASLIVCLVVASLSAVVLTYTLVEGKSFIYTMGHFDPNEDGIRICNEIRFGPIEALLAMFFAIVLGLVNLGGKKHQDRNISEKKQNLFYTMLCLVLVSCISLIYTNDIFTGFVFLEVSTLASCGCLVIKERGPVILPTIRYMIFNLVGSGLFLIGIVTLYDLTGYLSIENIATAIKAMPTLNMPTMLGMMLVVIGLSIKSGLFPFHFWMPDAYGTANATSSGVLSGIVTKGYVVLLIKVIFRMFTYEVVVQTPIFEILFVLGVIGMIVGSINAIHQTSLDRMIAFSSAAQIGYVFMGIGLGEKYALIAAFFHILSHATTKTLLFLTSANLFQTAHGSRKFRHLRGTGRVAIFNGVAFSIGAFSMVGLPLLAGFMSKYLFVNAAVVSSVPTWMKISSLFALVCSTVLNATYFGRTVITIYLPIEDESLINKENNKPTPLCYAGISGLLLINLTLGILASPIIDILEKGFELFC